MYVHTFVCNSFLLVHISKVKFLSHIFCKKWDEEEGTNIFLPFLRYAIVELCALQNFSHFVPHWPCLRKSQSLFVNKDTEIREYKACPILHSEEMVVPRCINCKYLWCLSLCLLLFTYILKCHQLQSILSRHCV